MVQYLRVLAVLSKGQNLVPGTNMVAYNYSQLSFKRMWSPLQASEGARDAYIHMQTKGDQKSFPLIPTYDPPLDTGRVTWKEEPQLRTCLHHYTACL